VRVFFGGEAIADSSRMLYLFEVGHLPVYNEKVDIVVDGVPQERPGLHREQLPDLDLPGHRGRRG
jgi:hypothetical protein